MLIALLSPEYNLGTCRFISRPRAPAISQQDEDEEMEGVYQTNDDIDIDYSIVKLESPMLSDTSRSTTPLINFVDDSIIREDFMVQLENEDQAVNLVSQTWLEMLEKAGQIPKTTTKLRYTVEADAQPRGKSISRVSLPHLTNLELDLQIPPKLISKPNAILLLRKNYNVEKHLFLFFKENRNDDVNIDFKVILNGCTFLKWSPAEKEVIVGFGGLHSEPFLERLKDKKVMERFNMLTIVDNKLASGE
ncbi:hypothetical protein Fcan01_00311 [Folsomia candida]|uniref:Uncharacterized protein n=1 Tax=Folsomia candida TaxID=158441 RepID=A0A226EZI0_FOLCA|nr:hypothetical protein Fcan01_00311 [Folsomia candida]